MAFLQKHAPSRSLRLAAINMVWLGIIIGFFGLCVLAVTLGDFRAAPSGFGKTINVVVAVLVGLGMLLPATLYVVCGVQLNRRQRWAATWGIMLTWGELAFAGLVSVASLAMCLTQKPNIIGTLITLVWLAALAQLLVHLRKARAYLDGLAHGPDPLHQPDCTETIAGMETGDGSSSHGA